MSFTMAPVCLVAVGLSWLITYSPLTLEAEPSLQTILDVALDAISVIAGVSALVVGIIALVRASHYPRGKAHRGFAIGGVILGGAGAVPLRPTPSSLAGVLSSEPTSPILAARASAPNPVASP